MLVAERGGWAFSRERIPMRIAAPRMWLVAISGKDTLVERNVLATDDEPKVLVILRAIWVVALATVISLIRGEVGARPRVHVARVLHRDFHAADTSHAKLAGTHDYNFVMEIPQSPSKTRCVDVHVWIILIVLNAIDIIRLLTWAPVFVWLVAFHLRWR